MRKSTVPHKVQQLATRKKNALQTMLDISLKEGSKDGQGQIKTLLQRKLRADSGIKVITVARYGYGNCSAPYGEIT